MNRINLISLFLLPFNLSCNSEQKELEQSYNRWEGHNWTQTESRPNKIEMDEFIRHYDMAYNEMLYYSGTFIDKEREDIIYELYYPLNSFDMSVLKVLDSGRFIGIIERFPESPNAHKLITFGEFKDRIDSVQQAN